MKRYSISELETMTDTHNILPDGSVVKKGGEGVVMDCIHEGVCKFRLSLEDASRLSKEPEPLKVGADPSAKPERPGPIFKRGRKPKPFTTSDKDVKRARNILVIRDDLTDPQLKALEPYKGVRIKDLTLPQREQIISIAREK